MTTARKLWLGSGTLTALLALVCVMMIVRLGSLEGRVKEHSSVARPRSAAARQLEVNVIGYAQSVSEYLHTGNPKARQDVAVIVAPFLVDSSSRS